MTATDGCERGHWTNGLERFYLHKEKRRFEDRFTPRGDWPMADGTMSTPDMHGETYIRPGEENALRRAFQRCHDFIHGNEGMGIVLPNGILGNPGDEYIRRWILRNCWVLACVEVPVEAFNRVLSDGII